MNHPKREEWTPYLFGEATPEARHKLAKHLQDCPDCAAEIAGWRRSLNQLDLWKLPRRPARSAHGATARLKWGIAGRRGDSARAAKPEPTRGQQIQLRAMKIIRSRKPPMKTLSSTTILLSLLWALNLNLALAQRAPAPASPEPNEVPQPGVLPTPSADEPTGGGGFGGGGVTGRSCSAATRSGSYSPADTK